MAKLIKPGLKFTAECIDPLYPTVSTYGIEECPMRNEVYVVCQDGSIQSVYEPTRPIGWELLENEDSWYYRVTQMNHLPKRCAVFYRGVEENPPKGIGSCRRTETQDAEISEQQDTGIEVCSSV